MATLIKYENGQKLGECIYLHDTGYYTRSNGKSDRKALFQCKCGNEFEALIFQVKSGVTRSCGCLQRETVSKMKRTHGLSGHRIYWRWHGMMQRCYNHNDKRYKDYGGRGITVCDEWHNDFRPYYDYMMSLPNAMKKGYSVDRIDNDGNYEVGNLRWASRSLQQRNRRVTNKTGYAGIKQRGNSFGARIDTVWIGSFKTAIDAARARDEYIIDNELQGYNLQVIQIDSKRIKQ